MKLLVIEDELEINDLISRFFTSEGFLVESATTFREASDRLQDYAYDCVLLDLSLPDGDGLDLIHMLKEEHSSTCIIVVSARDSIEDKINGLQMGADDYLAKPFSMGELNARVHSVIRRSHFSGNQEVVFNELKILPEQRQLLVNDQEVVLTPKEYDLLTYFLMNKHRVLSKESIVEHLWGDMMGISANTFDFVYTHIRNLRHKIVQAGGNDYIKSVYSIGYKFTDL